MTLKKMLQMGNEVGKAEVILKFLPFGGQVFFQLI